MVKPKRAEVASTLTMRLKARGMMFPLPGAKFLTCCLDEDTLRVIDKISIERYVRPQTLIDQMINNFVCTYEDKAFFIRGEAPKSFLDTVKGIVCLPPPRKFVTYQVRENSYDRVVEIKDEHGLSRSKILKYIIDKYMKENGYV